MINKLFKKLEEKLDDYSLKKKLMLFYICCVLVPLVITDGIILTIISNEEKKEQRYEIESIANAVWYDLSYTFTEAANMSNHFYINRSISEALEKRYESGLDFYVASKEVDKRNFYEMGLNSGNTMIVMCGDNETIVNGNHFYRISSVKDEEWYQKLENSENDLVLCFYYVGDKNLATPNKRKISLVRRLDYYKDLPSEKLVRIDLDYSTVAQRLNNMNYSEPVYICKGNKILFSNVGHSSTSRDFEYLKAEGKRAYEANYEIYGEKIRILIMEPENRISVSFKKHFPLFLLLLSINVLLPILLTVLLNHSLLWRITKLRDAFDSSEADSLKEISHISGQDEISNLMINYNRMVRRMSELIKTVYKDKLERQEMDIARKNAELLALHSQINPHFRFNVLENIRMHSILKGETETAEMIEHLAILERQNVNWKTDCVTVHEEIKLIERYLELQKYRFGNRLSYEIEVEEGCEYYYLPKLTLVTFVENACVHGVERKQANCWIYVRVSKKNNYLFMEVEDTGEGIEEEEVGRLLQKMQSCSMDDLRENKHVGMMNACLRLRMHTEENVAFELESEKGVGTLILIKAPVSTLKNKPKGE